jgi:hypothetical protein
MLKKCVCVYTIQLYNNIKDWVVIVYRRRKNLTAEATTLDWRQRRGRPETAREQTTRTYYERRREDEDFKKVRSDRYKNEGIQIDTPAETPTETPRTPVIETLADARLYRKSFIIKFTKNGVRTKIPL